jgi:hypothetical protein
LVTDFIKANNQHLIDRIRPSNESQFIWTRAINKHQNNNTIFAKLSLYLLQAI